MESSFIKAALSAALLLAWCTPQGSGALQAREDTASGQIVILENGKPVLRYNYKTIEPGDLLERVQPGNRIYTRARSDYIHPLYGLSGEALTKDWPIDHPHHRGIYWAWPEVDYGTERGDLHALQRVFARPTGKIKLRSGPDFAQVEAENLWQWEDREPIVRELTLIRASAAAEQSRIIDLAFYFLALKDGVTLARRGTTHYGGLNVRLETPKGQVITTNYPAASESPRRAWSSLSGVFPGATEAAALTVLQHQSNPDYPGEWIQYPELSWCQPAFPAPGTRYPLRREKPLILRYRLVVHQGSGAGADLNAKLWDQFQAAGTVLPDFTLIEPKTP